MQESRLVFKQVLYIYNIIYLRGGTINEKIILLPLVTLMIISLLLGGCSIRRSSTRGSLFRSRGSLFRGSSSSVGDPIDYPSHITIRPEAS